jgi:hypothetical protein
MVFDCLQARGKDLRSKPLYVRRNVIEDVLDDQDMVARRAAFRVRVWQITSGGWPPPGPASAAPSRRRSRSASAPATNGGMARPVKDSYYQGLPSNPF